jgi:hypothetical protein
MQERRSYHSFLKEPNQALGQTGHRGPAGQLGR